MFKVENLKTGEWLEREGRMTAEQFHDIVTGLTDGLDYTKSCDCVVGLITSFGQYHGRVECRSEKVEGGVVVSVVRYIDVDNEVHSTVLRTYFQPVIPGFEWVHGALAGLGL